MPDRVGEDFLEYLGSAPSPWHAAMVSARRLENSGFSEVASGQSFPNEGRCFLRQGGALVAWIVPESRPERLVLGLAHTDSPCLRVRPSGECEPSGGCRRISVETYGGSLNHGWLDRELELAGRLCARSGGGIREILVRPAGPRPLIPSLAIHFDRGVNERGLVLDRERHLQPLLGLSDAPTLRSILAAEAQVDPHDILSWDLCLSDANPPALAGCGDLVASPRLDNLASCHALLRAFQRTPVRPDTLLVVALLDAEETGSTWAQGADSVFLSNLLERIALACGLDREGFLNLSSSGLALSLDMAHGVHPDRPEWHGAGSAPVLGGGPVLKWNASHRYATSAPGAAALRELAASGSIPLQTFAMRADLACGSTVGPLVSSSLAIETVDCGAPMLAMHSSRETMALSDQRSTIRLCEAFLSRA
jgi:aspartyl aminopeptidase